MLKAFLNFCAPYILRSDKGREFTTNVINVVSAMCSNSKIVRGRPRHPQSQGSVEDCNQDIENMPRVWMDDNGRHHLSVPMSVFIQPGHIVITKMPLFLKKVAMTLIDMLRAAYG
ncbi:hypothetical protein AVEN_123939-1 [Araneus ventricosus]|uniref:Integrase catalytic domain-containing protein n=1 Tax=Araneus ventricosus TaxID=182803 RepID=A0A4Y2NI40_ARAVE|nr:hypothetical protein AVEN_123939-1 [Araneus ventricosus]